MHTSGILDETTERVDAGESTAVATNRSFAVPAADVPKLKAGAIAIYGIHKRRVASVERNGAIATARLV